MLLQGWFLPFAAALHRLAKDEQQTPKSAIMSSGLKNISIPFTPTKWLHWIHSVPNLGAGKEYPYNTQHTLPVNSKLVYLNNVDIVRAAEAYGLWPKDVRVVHNALDPRGFNNTHPLVTQLIDKYDLLSADFMQTYPVSTTRMMGGKGMGVLIKVFAALKNEGKKVKLVVCNAHANADTEKETIKKVQDYALELGLTTQEVIYTSLEGEEYEQGVPREVVSQLFQLSNLFVFPSTSENCSLILLEAMLSGNILILNDSVKAMREFGRENALYFKFGGIHESVEHEDEESYLRDVARIIIAELFVNRTLKATNYIKQKFNYDKIFLDQIQPLFYES